MHAIALALVMSLSVSASAGIGSREVAPEGDSIDTGQVHQSVISTVELLNRVYVYPETAHRVGVEVIQRLESGAYDGILTKREFADRIGAELAELSGDEHMGVLLAEAGEPVTHVLTETDDWFRLNHGFEKLAVMEGNIGYFKLNKFHQDEGARLTADHALGFLRGTDALIIDLRECKGGSPDLVLHMLSHFFSDETLLWRIVDRDGASVHDAVSESGVGQERFKVDFPIFILTSADTASAAELFAYTLKSYGKAKTVGQVWSGMAHLVGALPIDQHFIGRFSTYRNVNPVTNSDWEGVGVVPDTLAAPEHSLGVAVRLATSAIGVL